MLRARHRISRDIDAFIEDPQQLSFLSLRLAGEGLWACEAYEESSNHLRLIFPEGETLLQGSQGWRANFKSST